MVQALRLYISPFDQELSAPIFSGRLRSSLLSESFHSHGTRPEDRFGYVELPVMEAEKLKKRLNGSILKGKKLKVEDARPQKRGFVAEGGGESDSKSEPQRTRWSKRTRLTVEGRELSPQRSIKRGWTEPEKVVRSKDKKRDKSSPKSKYTDQKECLYRTQVPANKDQGESMIQPKHRHKKGKDGKNGTIVHEFEKSVTYPTFIKTKPSTSTATSTEFVDGKGWVDQDGNVVEEAPLSRRRKTRLPDPPASASTSASSAASDEQAESGSDLAADASVAHSQTSDMAVPTSEKPPPGPIPLITTTETTETARSTPPTQPTESAAAHPLETLFKRPNKAASQTLGKRPLEIKTAFSFFEPDHHDQPGGVPQTPFTTRDLHQRGLRSAAPTPDTALPTRRFFAESSSPEGDSGPDAGRGSPSASHDGKDPTRLPARNADQDRGESEFAHWFYQNRGENNRAWKKQRREAKKEKRQEENRVRGRRRA